jgi:hypothetical protein
MVSADIPSTSPRVIFWVSSLTKSYGKADISLDPPPLQLECRSILHLYPDLLSNMAFVWSMFLSLFALGSSLNVCSLLGAPRMAEREPRQVMLR